MNRTHRTMNVRARACCVVSAMCCLLWASAVSADVPHLIRYQGQAVDSQGVSLEGPYTLTFRLYDALTAGTKVWEEIQTNVVLQGGHFSVLLGQVTPFAAMDWSRPCWLSVQVGTELELAPRQRITSVPLAIRAEVAESLASGPTDISARVYKSASQSIPPNTATILTFDSEDYDTSNLHDNVTDNSRLTAPSAGKYLVWATVYWSPNPTGARTALFFINGKTTAAYVSGIQAVSSSGTDTCQSGSFIANLAAGEYLEIWVSQGSGAALSVVASIFTTNFGMMKLS